jgi:F-type H+-transporting ATPase subunit delta
VAAQRDIAGRRYATAIMDIARDDRDVEGWVTAIEALDALSSEARFVDVLQGDGMTDERFVGIIRRVLPDATEKQINLFRLLRRKSRLALGPSIAAFFREMVDEERGVVRATVTTAVELDGERRDSLVQRLRQQTGREIVLEERVDPGLLGGLVVRIGDQLLDASARTRLRQLRSRLERASIV